MYSKSIQKLIDLFSQFPTVGPRTAARFAFYLLKLPKEQIEEITSAIWQLKQNVKLCEFCFKPFEPSPHQEGQNLCQICQDKKRNNSLICVVEKESDLNSIENTKKYKGLYFILGGTVSLLKKQDTKNLRVEELLERAKNPKLQEIIIATNPTPEGEATALLLERKLKNLNKKVTRLGRGLPIGGELEYADEETLTSALSNRR